MLGAKSKFADDCFKENYIGVGFLSKIDFTHHLPDNWREFNQKFIPEYLKENPDKKKVTAGLACATVWILAKGIVTKYAEEIERLISGNRPPTIISTDSTVEDPSIFALEKHLEDFLVENWKQSELGKSFDIYEEEGELVGQQYPSDTGPIDILAISKDKKTLLVVELKKGRASDNVVGQIQRYMGYVKEELAEENQLVKGAIIALDDDLRIKRALSVTSNIDFYRYEISFKLKKQ